MKILQVNPFFSPIHGGSARSSYEISKCLSKAGHEVTVFTSDFKLSHDWIGTLPQVKVYPFKTVIHGASFYVTPGLFKKAMEATKHFDVIHMHNFRSFQNIVVAHYAQKYGIPYVLQAHGSLPRIMARQRLKWIYDRFLFGYGLLRDAAKVIALSSIEAQQYRSMGVPDEKIAIITNGIDLSEYTDLPPKGSFKKKFGLDENEKIVLYLGRIHILKGIDFLVRSFACLAKNGTESSKLVIAGPDDGYLDGVKSLVKSLGISDLVLFTGMLSEEDKISAYVDSAICAYLAQFEPFGLVTLEVAACGTPVIVFRGTPMARFVDEGKFGFSVKYNDIYQLTATMRKMLNDEEMLDDMGQKGRKFVFENFNWTDKVMNLERLYGEIVGN